MGEGLDFSLIMKKSRPTTAEVTPDNGLWRPTKAFNENKTRGKSFSKHLPELVKLAESGYVPCQGLSCRDQEYVHITDLEITFLDDLLCEAVDKPNRTIVKGGKLYCDYLAEVISEYLGKDEDDEEEDRPKKSRKFKKKSPHDWEDEGWDDEDDEDEDDDWEDDDEYDDEDEEEEDENFVCVRFPQDDAEWSRTRYTYSNSIGADVGDWVTVTVGREKKVVLIVADSDGNTLNGETSVRDYECRKATKVIERIASRHEVRKTKRKYDM